MFDLNKGDDVNKESKNWYNIIAHIIALSVAISGLLTPWCGYFISFELLITMLVFTMALFLIMLFYMMMFDDKLDF